MDTITENTSIFETLKKYFGYDSFRANQQEIIESLLSGKDNLVIMPTGGGKSMCFQLPAMHFPKTTLVISPLIALMKDQVDGLEANGIPAAFFNSSQSELAQDRIIKKVMAGTIKLLYVAPESLPGLSKITKKKFLSCIAIDEAHCISSWGHDFRPSYQQLGILKETLPEVPIIALTATADKTTRQDIIDQLNVPDARQSITSFDRPNIALEVRSGDKRMDQIVDFIGTQEGTSGIVYCLSRKNTEEVAEKLRHKGFQANAYHAGLSNERRNEVQNNFIHDRLQIVCATIAFGMGIDKSNVRWIVHHNLPKNIEGYYQEIGRAGRDGEPAHALLFHTYADIVQLRKYIEGASNEEIQVSKLERMKQFVDATSCRRKVLLGYFGEILEEDCGNCDMCKNPPTFIDGTEIATRVLTTISQVKGTEAIGVLIDILRGSQNAVIVDKGYTSLKNYGKGMDISRKDWKQYIIQLINQGYCELAFHKSNALQLTRLSLRVLQEGLKVNLTAPVELEEIPKSTAPEKKLVSVSGGTGETLFDRLKELRSKIAVENGKAAHLIFSDASLRSMETIKPLSEESFLTVSGVGQNKMNKFGAVFIKEIKTFQREKRKKSVDTFKATFELYEQGLPVPEIAAKREINATTIYSHLAKLYLDGFAVNLKQYITDEELEGIRKAKDVLDNSNSLKPYFEHFNEQMAYHKIRVGLTLLEKPE